MFLPKRTLLRRGSDIPRLYTSAMWRKSDSSKPTHSLVLDSLSEYLTEKRFSFIIIFFVCVFMVFGMKIIPGCLGCLVETRPNIARCWTLTAGYVYAALCIFPHL